MQECRDARGWEERSRWWRLLTVHGSYSNLLGGWWQVIRSEGVGCGDALLDEQRPGG
jgi:hypothetical protein